MHGYCPFPPPLYAGKKNFLGAVRHCVGGKAVKPLYTDKNLLGCTFSLLFLLLLYTKEGKYFWKRLLSFLPPPRKNKQGGKACSAEDERRAHRAAAPAEADVQVDELAFQHHAAA